MLDKLAGKGGPGRGQGRHPNQIPSKRIVIHATSEETQAIIAGTTPRERAETLREKVGEKHNNNLFNIKQFESHSGLQLDWRIECDDLSHGSVEWFAWMISREHSFG